MKHTRRLIALGIGAAVAAMAAIYIGWWGYRIAHYSERVSRISLGDSKAKVLHIVGRPVVLNKAPDHLWCSDPGTSYEYMYGTPIFASWNVIGFNKDDKVICKKELESP